MKRTPACIGLDQDVKEYLNSQDASMATFINCLVRAYKEQESIRATVGEIKKELANPIDSTYVGAAIDKIGEGEIECEEKIRLAILKHPDRWLRALRTTGKPPDKGAFQEIKDLVDWTCDTKVTLEEVKKVLKSVSDTYDWTKIDRDIASRKSR
jgi:hypothetical protein